MQKVKFIFTLLSFLLLTVGASAQNAKVQEKAAARVAKMEAPMVKVNPDAALSEEQKKEIGDLYAKMIVDTRKIKKSDATEEEKKTQSKAVRKSTNQAISKLLTKEQKAARKEANAARKAKED